MAINTTSAVFDIDFEDLEFEDARNDEDILGEGNFGLVVKASYFGTPVAVKQIFDTDDEDMAIYIEREMATLRTLRHPNIVQLLGLCRHKHDIFIVTEFIEGGDVRHLLKSDKILPWTRRVKMAKDCATAMAYLHSKKFIHRDLKSNNLLLGPDFTVKVCDFGFSRRIEKSKNELMTLCGTDEWMAPELGLGDMYDEKADVFSFAMVLTEFITRQKPPKRLPTRAFRFMVEEFKKTVPEDTPPEFLNLCIDCAAYYPEERPSFRDILKRLQAMKVVDVETKREEASDDEEEEVVVTEKRAKRELSDSEDEIEEVVVATEKKLTVMNSDDEDEEVLEEKKERKKKKSTHTRKKSSSGDDKKKKKKKKKTESGETTEKKKRSSKSSDEKKKTHKKKSHKSSRGGLDKEVKKSEA